MQKARRHPTKGLRPIVGTRFQALFHSPVRGPFHLSLTVLIAIGISLVFSLSAWSRIIQTGFLVSRPTQDSDTVAKTCAYGGLTLCAAPFQAPSASSPQRTAPSYNPAHAATSAVWAPPVSLAATRGIDCSFFSSAYLDVSVQRVCRLSPLWVVPFGDLRVVAAICASTQIIAACRVLHRRRDPRHPPCALLFFLLFSFRSVAVSNRHTSRVCFLSLPAHASRHVLRLFFPLMSMYSLVWRITDSNR